MKGRPLVSIIVPTYNSEKTLAKCLASIKNQTYINIEVIVVDNYSRDKTRQIAKDYADIILLKRSERGPARNFGVQNAKGGYLFFIDSDMELSPKVVEKCVRKIQEEDSFAVVVPEISVGEGFWAECKALEKSCYIGDETIEAARFFKKEVFFKFDGYDEEISAGGEDWDLAFRIKKAGYKTSRANALIKHHEGKLDLMSSLKKKYYYAQGINKYIKKHPYIAKKQLILLRPTFIRNWKKIIGDPIHAIGMIFMKSCEFIVGGLGYIEKELKE